MGLATAKYHVTLNGNGYLLVEESRRKRSQQPFHPRFSTGDNGLTDLSYWQFLAQDSWAGGQGQALFDTVTKYKQASGWDLRSGYPKLAYGPAAITATVPTLASSEPGTAVFDTFADLDYTGSPTWTAAGYSVSAASGSLVCIALKVAADYWNSGAVVAQTQDTGTFMFTLTKSWVSNSNGMVAAFFYCPTFTLTNIVDTPTGHDSASWSGTGYVIYTTGGTYKFAKFSGSSYTGFTDLIDTGISGTVQGASHLWTITRDSASGWTVACDGTIVGTVTDSTYTTCAKFAVFAEGIQSGDPTLTIDNIRIPSTTVNYTNVSGKCVIYNNKIVNCYPTTGSAFTFTTMVSASMATAQAGIQNISAQDICVFSRDGNIGGFNVFLGAVIGQTLKVFADTTEKASVTLTTFGKSIIPISSTKLVVVGTSDNNNGIPLIEVVVFDAGAWTVASQTIITLDGGVTGAMCSHSAVDANGVVYMVSNDYSIVVGKVVTRLFRCNSTDITAAKPTVSQIDIIPNFQAKGLFNLAGTIYLFGAAIEGVSAYDTIMKIDGTVVYKSTNAYTLTTATIGQSVNFGVNNIFKQLYSIQFLSRNDHATWMNVLELGTDGVVREIAGFIDGAYSYAQSNPISFAEYAGHHYLVNPGAGAVYRTGNTRGSFPSTNSQLKLELSEMGANTALVNKTPYTVSIELDTALPASETLYAYLNGTQVAAMVTADGTSKEFTISSDLTARKFAPTLAITYASTWQGAIKKFLLRYVPTQFKKKAFSIGIRATRGLKLIDGSRETRLPNTLVSELWTAYESNVPITFVDIDAVSYTVLVTDIDEREPLIDPHKAQIEALVFLELLQV